MCSVTRLRFSIRNRQSRYDITTLGLYPTSHREKNLTCLKIIDFLQYFVNVSFS